MRAVEFEAYGEAAVLKVRQVPLPSVRTREVLVKVHGTSVNPIDAKVRAGGMRLMSGRRFPKRTGIDFAGDVVAVGAHVKDFQIGDRVWGFIGNVSGRNGAAAEYIVAKPSTISLAPADLDLVKAAALPSVGEAAYLGLAKLGVHAEQRLLIVGASGGVGSAMIQLAHAGGAHVTAVASAANHGFCRDLGADETLDYSTLEMSSLYGRFDAVADCHGAKVREYRKALAPRGRMVTTSPDAIGFALASMVLAGPRIRVVMARPQTRILAAVTACVDRGDLRPVIDQTYTLTDISAAHRATETGHAAGKRVIDVTASTRPEAGSR